MTVVLDPGDPEVRAAAERARTILERIGAVPLLERLAAGAQRPREQSSRVDVVAPVTEAGLAATDR